MNENFNAENDKISLILDIYRAHTDKQVRALASQLNIDLFFIPAGATDLYQPLDRNIFGALKGKARGFWYTKYSQDPKEKFNLRLATQTLLQCWNDLNENSIIEGWSIYCELVTREVEDDCVETTFQDSIEDTEKKITISYKNVNCDLSCEEEEEIYESSDDDDLLEYDEFEEEEEYSSSSDNEIDLSQDADYKYSFDEDNPPRIESEISSSNNIQLCIDHENEVDQQSQMNESTDNRNIEPERQPTITNVHFSNIEYKDELNELLLYETEKITRRKTIAHSKKKKANFYEVVGITNYQYTCAFNVFIQLLSCIPHSDHFLNCSDPLECSIYNAICIIYHFYQVSFGIINPYNILKEHALIYLKKKTDAVQWANEIINAINDPNHSVITYIIDFIPHELYSFIQYNNNGIAEEKMFLSFKKNDFSNALHRIEPTSLNNYIFMIRDDGNDLSEPFTFPYQICLNDNNGEIENQKLLILQAIVININELHFEVFVRKSIGETSFLEINDSLRVDSH